MNWVSYSLGIILCVVIGAIAIFLSVYVPLGAVAIAIILGIIIGNSIKLKKVFKNGISFSEKHILALAVALMGVNINAQILKALGIKSILLVVGALIFTILISLVFSKVFGFDKKFSLLLGIGSGVCGSSAIAATEKIIGANEEEVGLSIATVNFLGTIGIFLVPFVSIFVLKLSDINSGILVGNTLQAVGQVVAGGFSISQSAGDIATIVKMTRILMLFPLVFILVFIFSGKKNIDKISNKLKVPPFIVGFVFFSLLSTFKMISADQIKIIAKFSHYLLVIAMSGIGLKITLHSIIRDGKAALLIGGLLFLLQIMFSSIILLLFF